MCLGEKKEDQSFAEKGAVLRHGMWEGQNPEILTLIFNIWWKRVADNRERGLQVSHLSNTQSDSL